MKTKLFFLLSLLSLSFGINAQNIVFADANLKSALLRADLTNNIALDGTNNPIKIDANGDGEIQSSEIANVSTLNISNANITTLDDIVNFVGFSKLYTIDCSGNSLTQIDFSKLPYYLRALNCSRNNINLFVNLNLMQNLYTLDCSYNQLANVDSYSAGGSLNCSHNQITSIHLQQNSDLDCSYNLLTSLILPTLYTDFPINLNCSNNQLTNLSVKNVNIASLDCSNNQIASLDFQDKLTQNISFLNINNNVNLTSICRNEEDVLPDTGSVSQSICNNSILGFDAGLKKVLINTSADSCNQNYWNAKDINGICLTVDVNGDGELSQTELDVIAYLNFFQNAAGPNQGIFDNFITTQGINYLHNLKSISCRIISSHSHITGNVGDIIIDGLQNLEKIDFSQFYVGSIKISNCPKLNTVISGTTRYSTTGNTTSYDFKNCPLLENVVCIAGNLQSLTFQNCPAVKSIDAKGNQLSALDVSMLPNLESLYTENYNVINNSDAQEIISFPRNNLSSLDLSQNINLKKLQCNQNAITYLDLRNNKSLLYIDCSNNFIENVNVDGLENLAYLDISNNHLATPFKFQMNYNNSIDDIYMGGDYTIWNQNSIYIGQNLFRCKGNKITSITVEGNATEFKFFDCSDNLLNSLFLKTGNNWASLNSSNFPNNNLYFSENPDLKFICVDDSSVAYVKNLALKYGLTHCNVNSYCSFVPGGSYNTITGKVRFDENGNGCDTSDGFFENMKVSISDGTNTGSTFVQKDGTYKFYAQEGNFNIAASPENSELFAVTPDHFSTSFADSYNNVSSQDLCVTKNGTKNDLEVVIAPVVNARPGFDATYRLLWRNKGNTTLSGNITLDFNGDKMRFISSQLPSTISGNKLSFNFSDLKPYGDTATEIKFNINPPTDPTNPVNIGDLLHFTAKVSPESGDTHPEDNTFILKQTVTGSYDPNEIICLEGDSVPASNVGNYLHYVVNFENTGTGETENIVVAMEINPEDYDISTLQLQNSSFPVYTRITGNKVEFIMKNAILKAGEHGNVMLKMKPLSTKTTGLKVTSNANIFFDYNFPVQTNDAVTNFVELLQTKEVKDNSVAIYPIPTKGELNISADSKIGSIEIYDPSGRIIQKQICGDKTAKVTINSNSKGNFYLKIKTEKGVMVKKVIKE